MPATPNHYSENCDGYKLSQDEFKFFSKIFKKGLAYKGKQTKRGTTYEIEKNIIQYDHQHGNKERFSQIIITPGRQKTNLHPIFTIHHYNGHGYLELDEEHQTINWFDFKRIDHSAKTQEFNSIPCSKEEVDERKDILSQAFYVIPRLRREFAYAIGINHQKKG